MSSAGGPRIVRDELALHLDAVNRKSLPGRPTTNYYPTVDSGTLRSPRTAHFWDGVRWKINSTYSHPGVRGPKGIFIGKVYKFTSGALNSSWSGNSYGYMLKDIAVTNGATVVQSCWVYVSNSSNLTAIPSVIEGEAGGEASVSGYNSSYDMNAKGTWQRLAKKATSDGNVRFIPVYPRRNGVTDGSFSGFFMWGGPMVEEASTPSYRITTGTRGTTAGTGGGWKDRSRNSNHGQLLNGVTPVDITTATGALQFDGTNDEVRLNGVGISSWSDPFTMEVWINIPTGAVWDGGTNRLSTIFANVGGYGGSYGLVKWGSTEGRIGFYLRGDNGGISTYGDGFSRDTWHHLVGTWNGTQTAFYGNGQLVSGPAGSARTGVPDTVNLTLGLARAFSGSTGAYFEGLMANAKYYYKALTAKEVLRNYNATKGRFGL